MFWSIIVSCLLLVVFTYAAVYRGSGAEMHTPDYSYGEEPNYPHPNVPEQRYNYVPSFGERGARNRRECEERICVTYGGLSYAVWDDNQRRCACPPLLSDLFG